MHKAKPAVNSEENKLSSSYLDGATPISVGPRPLNNARTPSVRTMCLEVHKEKYSP